MNLINKVLDFKRTPGQDGVILELDNGRTGDLTNTVWCSYSITDGHDPNKKWVSISDGRSLIVVLNQGSISEIEVELSEEVVDRITTEFGVGPTI